MSINLIIREEIPFKVAKNIIWDLLTNPEKTKQYMFGCEVSSNWKIGSQILWKGFLENGTTIIYVKGTIIDFDKERKLTFTMFDPNIGIADIPENYVNLTYEILERETGCVLKIEQGDFYKTENATQRFEEAKQGWKMVIPLMRKLVNENF